ncbi:MAG: ribonuclease Z [Flavobacteriaceae bacterium]
MTFDINDKTAIITYDGSDTIGRPFRDEIKRNYKSFSSLNIVVDLSLIKPVLSKHIKDFVELSGHHKNLSNKSFVIVTGPISLKRLPEGLNVVPTLHEALDTVEIEEIERDLGI